VASAVWLFEGIRKYFGGDAIHEYVLGSRQYDSFVEECTPETRTQAPEDLVLRNRQYETRVRTEQYVVGEYAIKKCHTLAKSLRDGSIVRNDRTLQVSGPPTRVDQITRGGWLTFWSFASLNGAALAMAAVVGTDVGTLYKGIPSGLPSHEETQLYTQCRENPLVEVVSVCRDDWVSQSTGPGTCSWHGGVSRREEIVRERTRRECVRLVLERR
jgi:hypothetical protein